MASTFPFGGIGALSRQHNSFDPIPPSSSPQNLCIIGTNNSGTMTSSGLHELLGQMNLTSGL